MGWMTGNRMTFDEVAAMKKGDEFYEVDFGQKIKGAVKTKPKVKGEGKDQHCKFEATVDGKLVGYALTRGYMHYSPKIYALDQIIQIQPPSKELKK